MRDTTRIKTETSWVRKLIIDLKSWAFTQPERDYMLDLVESNLLLVQYVQLEKMLTTGN